MKQAYEDSTQSQIAPSAEAMKSDTRPVNSPFYAKNPDLVTARRNMLIIEEQEGRRAQLNEIHATRLLRVCCKDFMIS